MTLKKSIWNILNMLARSLCFENFLHYYYALRLRIVVHLQSFKHRKFFINMSITAHKNFIFAIKRCVLRF